MTTKLRTLVASAWTLLIFGLCWTPRTMLPVAEESGRWIRLPGLDKLVHFALFAGFGCLWGWAGVRTRWVLGLGLLAAVASELGQATRFVNRDAGWYDGSADALGLVVGVASLSLARRALTQGSAPARTPSVETP